MFASCSCSEKAFELYKFVKKVIGEFVELTVIDCSRLTFRCEDSVLLSSGSKRGKEMRRRVNCFLITDAVDGLADSSSGDGSRNFGVCMMIDVENN